MGSQFAAWESVPEDVQNEMRVCIIDTMLASYDQIDLASMNAYARGERPMTSEELSALNKRAQHRAGLPASGPALLKRTCPDTISKMESYGQTPGISMNGKLDNTKYVYPNLQSVAWHMIQATTPDEYPSPDRRKLVDCASWAMAKDVPPAEQKTILAAINSGGQAALRDVVASKWVGYGTDAEPQMKARVMANFKEGCPDLAAKYPNF